MSNSGDGDLVQKGLYEVDKIEEFSIVSAQEGYCEIVEDQSFLED